MLETSNDLIDEVGAELRRKRRVNGPAPLQHGMGAEQESPRRFLALPNHKRVSPDGGDAGEAIAFLDREAGTRVTLAASQGRL